NRGSGSSRSFQDLEAVLVPSERRHQVYTVRLVLALVKQVAGELDADALPFVPGLMHAAANPFGNVDARDLVVEELGVAEGLERQDADEDGNLREPAQPLDESLPATQLVHRLRHDEVRAGVELLLHVFELGIEVLGGGVDAAADRELGERADRGAGEIRS